LCQEGFVSLDSFEDHDGTSFETQEGNQALKLEILKNQEDDVINGSYVQSISHITKLQFHQEDVHVIDCPSPLANQRFTFFGLHEESDLHDVDVSSEACHEHPINVLNMNDRRKEHIIHSSSENEFNRLQMELQFE